MTWTRGLALIAGWAVLGCGGPARPTTPPPATPGPSAPTTGPMPADAAPLPAALRAALAARLRAYGSGWDLAGLERVFTIAVDEEEAAYLLRFTARGASGLWAVRTLGKVDGFGGPLLALPDGPALAPAQQAEAEAILRASSALWMTHEGRLAPLDLSAGLVAAVGGGLLEARRRDGLAVLYVVAPDQPIFAIAIDLARRRVTEAGWHDLPPGDSALIPAEEIAFLDAALRRHGDFGVYGNVTAGLTALLRTSAFSLTRRDGHYHLVITPRDGHGHELAFRVDAHTGAISDLSAGHLAPVE